MKAIVSIVAAKCTVVYRFYRVTILLKEYFYFGEIHLVAFLPRVR